MKDRANQETPDDVPSTATPSTALEETLEEHLGIYPGEHEGVHEGHEPSEHSYWPVVTAISVLLIGVGFLSSYVVSAAGTVLLMVALVGWFNEPWVS